MINGIQNIEHLISKTDNDFSFFWNFISSHKNYVIKSFESDYENIYDIYYLRWQHLKEQGKSITGLDKLIKNLQNSENIKNIKTTILTDENEKVAIFSDLNYKLLLGIIYFNNPL